MCSVGLEGDDFMVPKYSEPVANGNGSTDCKKCKSTETSVKLRGKDFYCRNCFLLSFQHKFRSALGKSRQFKPNDRVMVVITNDSRSWAILHLIKDGLEENSHKKLRIKPLFIYLSDFGDITSQGNNKILNEITKLGFTPHLGCLADIYEDPQTIYSSMKSGVTVKSPENATKLHELIYGASSSTSREDLLNVLWQHHLQNYARALDCTKIFLPDEALDIATNTLSNVALGRGLNLPQFTHFHSTINGISFYRPIKDISTEEIRYFLNIRELPIPMTSAADSKDLSIRSLTKQFLVGLQADFPATIPTVCKISDKIDVQPVFNENSCGKTCELCGLEFDPLETPASQAKNVSIELSNARIPSNHQRYCYACRNISHEMEHVENLPLKMNQERAFEQMRSQIADFLID